MSETRGPKRAYQDLPNVIHIKAMKLLLRIGEFQLQLLIDLYDNCLRPTLLFHELFIIIINTEFSYLF